ncbi:hypothetical protein LO762_16480 [Actinocorallia sp. API 0066]|uniref:VG15 protein n=1 Tax=Actinocorallia sp. API 0066 TaxID=2896846 RepID=UPI001E288BF1|nr:hypothetical protein [Actinocorallia sp. API 0066]MCD0450775.1 hypothetical protein [Actinocorallia sp. API 0066]
MARTAEGAALTAQHTRQQLALRAGLIRDLQAVWPLWAVGEVAEFSAFLDVAVSLIQAGHTDSAAIAARYFRQFRAAEDVAGTAEPRLAPRLNPADIAASLRATGLAGTMRALRAGHSPQAASRAGFVLAQASATRLALSGGRDTVTASSQRDGRAQGWIRVASGNACAFCAMLASRGNAYTRERGAAFQAHDGCGCSPEPFYAGSRLPATSERYARLWEQSRDVDVSDTDTKHPALTAFRRLIEG